MMYQFEITYDGSSTIVDEPKGWADVDFVRRRDEKFYGVFFEFSSELSFHSEAYTILMNAFETDDVNAEVSITIRERKVNWKPFTIFFQGVVLFDSIKFDNRFITVTLEKLSILRDFKNVMEKPFEIIPNKTINVHSQPLYFESKFTIEDTLTGSSGGGGITPQLLLSSNELETTINQGAIIFYNGEAETRQIRVHGHINCTAKKLPSNNDRGLKMFIVFKPTAGGLDTSHTAYTNAPSPTSQTHSFDFDHTVNVPFDHNIFIKFDDDSFDGQTTTFNFTAGSFIKLTEVQEGEQNIMIKGVTFYEAFDQICEAYLGANTFASTALQESNRINNLLTNGFQLRQKDEPIVTDFKQLLNAVKTIFNCGLEVINNQIVISNYSDIYDTSSNQTITAYSQPEYNIYSNHVFNQIELKYDKYNLSDLPALNGLYEFNTSRIFAINSSKLKGKKALQPKLIAAGTSIERLIRRRLQDSNSYSEDNNLAVIALNKTATTTNLFTGTSQTHATGTVSERNEALSITNVLEPSKTFNIRLSPRRIIAKHLSDYFFINDVEFEYLTNEGNNDTVIQAISENANIANATTKYKSPLETKFTTDETLTSDYIELDNKNYFINEIKTKLNGKSTVTAVKSFI